MSPPITPPPDVVALADARVAARAGRDFATADRLREEIADAGWIVTDTAAGWRLAPEPPYEVFPSLKDLPERGDGPSGRATAALLVEGWPGDLRECVDALVRHAPPDLGIIGLDLGNVDGAGDVLHELATAHPDRVREWHVASPAGWASARSALLRLDTADVHIWLETSTICLGDGLSPVLDAFADPGVVGAGWRGANVDLADEWRSFVAAGPGEVDALLGYLFAMRRAVALDAGGPHPKARFYRNADMEFSFALRQASGGRLLVPPGDLPLRQNRHRGYADSDPAYRDRESKRNYDRFLQRFRGRTDLLAPRTG
ncbi:MAG: glycosyltransferase [Frankiaceae bacterium]